MTFKDILTRKAPWWQWLAHRKLRDLSPCDITDALQDYLGCIRELSPIDTDAALATCSELTGVKAETIRRELRAIVHGDRRAVTSAANGKKGGRPSIVYAELADEFVSLQMRDGIFRYRSWRDRWWRYKEPLWSECSKADMKSLVTTFTGRRYPEHSEVRAVANITLNLERMDRGKIPDSLDAPCWLPESGESKHKPAGNWLTMKNGLLNIDAAQDCFDGPEYVADPEVFRPINPRLFNLHCMDYDFDHEAQCPKWLAFLETTQPNPEDRWMLQLLAGLLLVPEVRFNVFFILTGPGGCGKSVFLHVIESLLGDHNTCCVPLTEFANDHYKYHLTEKLLNSIDDMPVTGQMREAEGMIKIATDGRPMPIRRLYEDSAKANVIARTVAACNTLPKFYEKSDAIWERLRIIPFSVKVRGTGKQDSRLRHKISENELPGVFMWALRGLSALRDMQVFPEHSAGAAAKEKHSRSCDPVGSYLKDHYTKVDREAGQIESRMIYDHYRAWAESSGHKPASMSTINEAVEREFEVIKERFRVNGPAVVAFKGLVKNPDAFERPVDDIPV